MTRVWWSNVRLTFDSPEGPRFRELVCLETCQCLGSIKLPLRTLRTATVSCEHNFGDREGGDRTDAKRFTKALASDVQAEVDVAWLVADYPRNRLPVESLCRLTTRNIMQESAFEILCAKVIWALVYSRPVDRILLIIPPEAK